MAENQAAALAFEQHRRMPPIDCRPYGDMIVSVRNEMSRTICPGPTFCPTRIPHPEDFGIASPSRSAAQFDLDDQILMSHRTTCHLSAGPSGKQSIFLRVNLERLIRCDRAQCLPNACLMIELHL